jgi:hypothetical protein
MAAYFVCLIALTGDFSRAYFVFSSLTEDVPLTGIVLLLSINILFDYLSVTKSRVLIRRTPNMAAKNRAATVVLTDLILTVLIIGAYLVTAFVVVDVLAYSSFKHSKFGHVGGVEFGKHAYASQTHDALFGLFEFPLIATIALTFILSVLYLLALRLLIRFGYAGRDMNLVGWILPINTLPIRSVGIAAGIVLFILWAHFIA